MIEAVINVTAEPVIEFTRPTGSHDDAHGQPIAPDARRRASTRAAASSSGWRSAWPPTSSGRASATRSATPSGRSDPRCDTLDGRARRPSTSSMPSSPSGRRAGPRRRGASLLASRACPPPRPDPTRCSRAPAFVRSGFYEEVDHPSLGTYPSPGLPFRFASVDHWLHRAAPMFGEHNHDVLTRILGLSDAEIAELEAEGSSATARPGCSSAPSPTRRRSTPIIGALRRRLVRSAADLARIP